MCACALGLIIANAINHIYFEIMHGNRVSDIYIYIYIGSDVSVPYGNYI
jgi:hypothetical protein